MRKQGYPETTLRLTSRRLRHLNKYCNLDNPEAVKEHIAKKTVASSYKRNLCTAYHYYTKVNKIEWDRPRYKPKKHFEHPTLRLCFTEAIKNKNMPHEMRMALVHEAYANGLSKNEIVSLFENQSDFNKEQCEYYVEKMLATIVNEGGHPYRCETIISKKWCLKEHCPIYIKFKQH